MKKLTLFTFLAICCSFGFLSAQTTEVFETEASGSTTFTDNGQVFIVTSQLRGPFDIQTGFPGTGWNGTATDNQYIDNDTYAAGGFPIGFTITSNGSIPFILNSMWMYLADQNASVAVSGSLTLVGKLGGVTKYNVTQSSGFNQNGGTNAGFSLINLATFGSQNNSGIPIDEIVITTTNNFNYVALDAFNWTVTAPEANIKGNSVSIVDGDATPSATDHSDFGSQSVCSGGVVRTYTIENLGTRAMTVTNAVISGTHAADFTVTSAPPSSIAAGGSGTFQVTFNPSATGTRSATVTVNCSDANEAAYDFAIQGTGQDPETNVQGNSVTITDGDATPSSTDHTDFGSTSICSGTIVRTFTVQNTGTSNLTLGTVTIGGTNAGDFSVTATPSTPVSAAGSTTFQVTFNPTASGTRSADISFTTNDCDEATYNFNIQGTGQDPEINVQGNSNSIADGDATPSITDHTDFGSQSVCSGTIVRTFTVQNTGTSNLTLGTVTIGGANAGDFSVTASPSTPVSAAGSTTFQVTFNPTASGTRSADISFTTNDCDEATYNFNIQGTGQDPEINVQGNSNSIADGDATPSMTDDTDFGSQSVCSGTIVRTFTIQNTGTSNLTLGTVTIGGTNPGDFSVTATPSSPVSAAGSTTFQVTFNPTASGTRSADISFTTNDCDEATYNFSIQGIGTDPEINVQGNSNSIADGDATPSATDHTDFGSQDMCTGTIVRTFTIQNTGNVDLTITSVNITGTDAADYSVTASPSSPVSAAGSTTFQVTFNPSAAGARNATITVNTSDCDEAAYDFAITGNGSDGTPNADDPADVAACDSYTLPALTVGNYFTGSGGTGTALSAGNNITSTQTIYVYAVNGACSDENGFLVTINTSPTADDPSDVTACDSYELLPLTVGNYFTGAGGTGTALSAGNMITSTQTIYVYAETGTTPNCTDENSFVVTINNTPTADDPADVTACDSYELLPLTVGNYFTGAGGTGTALSAGNMITSTQTIYVYAETGTTPNCTDENSFVVTINTTPTADDPADVTACDSYELLPLTVGNYFTGAGGTGTALSAGNMITSTQTIYVYAQTGTTPNCTDENSFVVTINTTPVADDPADVTACDSYELLPLTVGNYFTGAGGTGTALNAGNMITSTQTIYVYAQTGTTPNCTDENSFVVTINTVHPTVSSSAGDTRCGTGTVDLTAAASSGSINWYDDATAGSLVGSGSPFTTPSISSTTTYYAEAVDGACVSTGRTAVTASVKQNSEVQASQQGTTLATMGQAIVADAVAGATNYRFEVTENGNTEIITRTDRWFYLNNLAAYDYAKTYSIRVAVETSGTFSCYGTAYNVSSPALPTTQVQAFQCGATIPTLFTAIQADYFAGATKYRFEVSSTHGTETVTNTTRFFYLNQLSTYTYGTSYTIRVAVEYNSTFGAYGNSCVVNSPSVTTLQASQCNNSVLPASNTPIIADAVSGATGYKFEVTIDGVTEVLTRTVRWFYLANLSSYGMNNQLRVRVAVQKDGVWGPFYTACFVKTPTAWMAQDETIYAADGDLMGDISVEAYPNPNEGDFTVSSTHAGQFNIINEVGQLIQKVNITKENNLSARVEGLQAGVYFVTGTINNEFITKKVMVLK